MLTISEPLAGICETANYYVRYYTSKMEGVWLGRGAALLGLLGAVQPAQMRHLLAGLSPEGSRPLVQNARHPDRQAGWDLTFSAPKSVSVFWALAPEAVRQEVERAHQRAVQTAIAFLEEKAGVTRRGKGGKIREKAVLVVAAFQDHVSRELDPQLHTHAVTFNLCVRSDGTTGSIRSKDIFEHKMAIGAVYRQALEVELQESLGLDTRKTREGFEVQGVPEKLCDQFSKRRQQIQAELARGNQSAAVAAKAAAIKTRNAPRAANLEELFVAWQTVGASFGWSTTEALQLAKRLVPTPERSKQRKPEFEQAHRGPRPNKGEVKEQKSELGHQRNTNVAEKETTQNRSQEHHTKSKARRAKREKATAQSQKRKPSKLGLQPFHVRWWVLREQTAPRVDESGMVHRPAVVLKLPYLVLGPKPNPQWGRIYAKLLVGQDSEVRVQSKRLFPRAPSFNPFSKLELPALRWYLYNDVERLQAALRTNYQPSVGQKDQSIKQEQERRDGGVSR